MGANEKLSLQIDTTTTGTENVDRLAEAMNRVVSQADKAGNPGSAFSSFPSAIKRFVQDPLGAAESSVTSFASGFGAAGVAVAGTVVGISAIIGASASATRALAAMGIETQNIALKTGLTTREVGQFSFAAKAVGADIGVFETGMRKLSQGLADGGLEGKKTREELDALGVKTRALDGQIRPTADIFEQIATKIGTMGSAAERNAALVKIFGRSGIDLVPVMESLNANVARAKELGFGLDDATVARYTKYQQQIAEIDAKWEVAKRHFADGISGTIWISLKGAGAFLLDPEQHGGGVGVQSGGLGYVPHSPLTKSGTDVSFIGPRAGAFQLPDGSTGPFGGPLDTGAAVDEARFQKTLAGAQAKLEELKDKARTARNDYFGGAGQVGDGVAAQNKKAWEEAEAAALEYEDRVKLLTKSEAQRIAGIEKARTLDKGAEGYFRFAGANGTEFVTKSEQQAGLDATRKPPTLLREGDYDPADTAFRDRLAGPLPSGLDNAGTFVSNSDDRREPGFNGIATAGLFDDPKYKQAEQIKVDGLHSEFDFTSRILALRTGPGGEFEAAEKTAALRLNMIESEVTLTGDLVKYEAERTQIAYDSAVRLQELKAKDRDSFRQGAGSVFDAATSANPSQALRSFGISAGRDFGKTIFENLATQQLLPLISSSLDKLKSSNPLLKGTFLYDPVKAATDTNTAALVASTAAVTALTTTLTASLPGSFASTNGLDPSWTALPGSGPFSSTTPGSVFGGAASWNPFVFNNQATGLPGPIGSSAGGLDPSWTSLPGYDPAVSGGSTGIGFNSRTATSAVAIGSGALAAFDGFSHGGARGAAEGVSGVLGSAAGIAALFGPAGAPVALGLGIAAAATGFITSLLPDPKALREKQITKTLEQDKYLAPTALNVSQDSSGNYVDFDSRGNLRQSAFRAQPVVSEPYTWWKGQTPYDVPGSVTSPFQPPAAPPPPPAQITLHLNAIDAQSGVDFLRNNHAAIGEALADHLQNSAPSRASAEIRNQVLG